MGRLRSPSQALIGALVAVTVTYACGNPLPTTSSQRCRKYATTVTYGPQNSYTGRCTFSASQYDCTIEGNHRVQQYKTVQDFIEEARVPNRFMLSSEQVSSAGPGLGGGSGYYRGSYVYDEKTRLVRIDWTGRSGFVPEQALPPTLFTEWDALGRPLAGTEPHGESILSFTIAYDDGARTMEWSDGQFVQQDVFGNTIRRGDSIYTVTQMAEVCQ